MVKRMDNKDLISQLSNDLKPVKVLLSSEKRTFIWIITNLVLTATLMAIFAPIDQHTWMRFSSVTFVIENLLAFVAITSLAYQALLSIIPGSYDPKTQSRWSYPIIIYFIFFLIKFIFNIEVVDEVHRHQCPLQVIAFSFLPVVQMIFLLRKGFFFESNKSFLLASSSSGLYGAWLMNMLCFNNPIHNLILHFIPSIIIIFIYSYSVKKIHQ